MSAEVTQADRERARECIGNGLYYDEMRERIATALAEERARAQAPFLKTLVDLAERAAERDAEDAR